MLEKQQDSLREINFDHIKNPMEEMGLRYQDIDDFIDDMITMMTRKQFIQFQRVLSGLPQYHELARNLMDEWLICMQDDDEYVPYPERVSSPSTAPQSYAPVTESLILCPPQEHEFENIDIQVQNAAYQSMTCNLDSIFGSAAKERSEFLNACVNTLARACDFIKKLLQLEPEVNTQPAQSALNKVILDLKEIHDQCLLTEEEVDEAIKKVNGQIANIGKLVATVLQENSSKDLKRVCMVYAAIESLLELNKELEDRKCASGSVKWQKEMLMGYLNKIDSKIKPSSKKHAAATIAISGLLAVGCFMCIFYVPVSLPIVAKYIVAGTGSAVAGLGSAYWRYDRYQHKCDEVKTSKSKAKRQWAVFNQ